MHPFFLSWAAGEHFRDDNRNEVFLKGHDETEAGVFWGAAFV